MWRRDPLSPGRCPLEDRTGLPQGTREVRPLLNDTAPPTLQELLVWFLRPTLWSRGQGVAGPGGLLVLLPALRPASRVSSARGEGLGGPAEGGASAGGRGQVDGPRGAPPQRCPNFPRLRWVLGGLTRHRCPSRSGAGVARLAQPFSVSKGGSRSLLRRLGGHCWSEGAGVGVLLSPRTEWQGTDKANPPLTHTPASPHRAAPLCD